MSGEIAAVADVLTGTALARAVEPEAGEGKASGGTCLNCGTKLTGAHCHACGQKAQVHRTLHAFGHDILHSVLHFDGKIWRTLPMLFWKPGDLTRRYVHGERARFVSPLALFLFTVFLTFAAFNWLVPTAPNLNGVVSKEAAEEQYQADRKALLDDISEVQADRKEADADQQPGREWRDGEIARLQGDLKTLDENRGKEIRQSELAARKIAAAKSKSDANIARLEAELKAARAGGKPTAAIEEKLESETVDAQLMDKAMSALGQPNEKGLSGNWTFTDPSLPGAATLNEAFKHATENPQLVLYKIQSNTYKYSWALIPISVPFVWLLFFWRRQFKMFDHAVFVTYSLSFMMLLGVLCAILLQFPATEVIGGLGLSLVPPIHMYRQLHHAYRTSRFGAFWRMCVLSIFALTALTLFAVLVVTLGITG
jgi:Protein of unknown function (DUF3667)